MDPRLSATLSRVFTLPVAAITPELSRDAVSNWDSLRQMDLVVSIEQEFGIVLDIPDILKMKSVATIVEVLVSKGVTLEA
jgi:acyl carrier protein